VKHGDPALAIHTRAIQKAILAPEIERYLSRRHVDLLVTDQLEALQVRVARGIEVLERKIASGLKAARSRALLMVGTAAAGFLLAAAHGVLVAGGALQEGGPRATVLWIVAVLAMAAALLAAVELVGALSDAAKLQRLAGRYRGGVESARTPAELLDFAEQALADARALGAVPSRAEEEGEH
jgi:hypothetical protein